VKTNKNLFMNQSEEVFDLNELFEIIKDSD